MENPERAGPDNEGAAIVMGNSVPTWRKSYWKAKRHTQADKAVKAMAEYRAQLLKEAGYLVPQQSGDDGQEEESE